MPKLTLNVELEFCRDSSKGIESEAVGWYLPGTSIDAWLAAVEQAGIDANHRLFVAPTSVSDVRASGLLFLAKLDRFQNAGRSKGSRDAEHKLRIPLGAIGLRGAVARGAKGESLDRELWLPVIGQLSPNVSPQDLLASTQGTPNRILVWLPSVGLIAFEHEDAFQVTQLLRRPVTDSNEKYRWRALPDAPILPDRIHGFLVPVPPSIEKMFEKEQKEIGGKSAELDKLAADGTSSGAGIMSKAQEMYNQALEFMLGKLAKHQQKITSQENAATGNPPSRANIAAKISLKLIQRLAQSLQAQRDKQIEKLLQLMKKDPDKALKFAIPLAAMSAFRGLSLPTGKLLQQIPNFNLGGLFGSGPADIWNINAALQAQLQAAYREQADRELAAGRYRRAAYIHANLLGDLSAAAAILEKGRYYDEAAVLYGEKLNRPRDFARCMAMAGRTAEAAALYIKLNDYEAAAKVWDDVDNREKVREVYLKAIVQLKGQGRIVDAARMLDEKLDDRTNAELLLWEQWPNGREVVACAELGFQWLAENGRHSQAHEVFADMVEKTNNQHLQLATIAAKLTRTYPDRELQLIAEDRCRLATITKLQTTSDSELSARLRQIEYANSHDALLIRDSARFERIEKAKTFQLQPIASDPKASTLQPMESVKLPDADGCVCRYGEAISGELFAIVSDTSKLHALRVSEPFEKIFSRSRIPLVQLENVDCSNIDVYKHSVDGRLEVIVSLRGGFSHESSDNRLRRVRLGQDWLVRLNPYQPESCGGIGDNGIQWSLSQNGEVLYAYNDGTPTTYPFMQRILAIYEKWSPFFTSSELVIADEVAEDSPFGTHQFKMVVNGNRPVIAAGRMLASLKASELIGVRVLDGFPNCMVNSPPHTSSRVAIGTERTLSVLWLDRNNDMETVAQDDCFKLVAFMHGGRLMATTERELHCYQRSDKATTLRARVRLRDDRSPNRNESVKPVALLPINTEVIAVLYDDGVLDRYRVS